ncbi:MAG: 2Fe-2S iron-sulfur cluster-binding protein [Candidatus Polarisedimenticolia bacterium]
MPDTVKLTIDGKEIEVPKGTTVLQAAGMMGLDVPRYCYHPGLTIAGNCRICLVDIEKTPKLSTSCTTIAADGMVVHTAGAKVEEGRRGVMEFLLANHPLDCPICDQAGECRLQDYAYEHGQGGSRFVEEKLKGFKQKSIGPHVVLDTERCIVCTRCVRFTDEITHTGELGVFQRGAHAYIDIVPGHQLDNLYSGNTVDICPVGALTLKEFRFKKRVWELHDVPSVCGACARGCNVNVGTADNEVHRLTPRENQAVNRWWMCDVGRLSHLQLEQPRLLEAASRTAAAGESRTLPWPEALDLLAQRLRAARPGAVAVVASASLTLEDLYMLSRLSKEVLKEADVVLPAHVEGEDDALLIRADKTANAAGAGRLGLALDDGARLRKVLKAGAEGRLDLLLVLSEPVAGLDALQGKTFVAVHTPFAEHARHADLALPAAAWGEFEGTWVNFQHRAQRVRRALTPPGVALEGWRLISELMLRMGVPAAHASAGDVLGEMSARVESLRALAGKPPGPLGVAL